MSEFAELATASAAWADVAGVLILGLIAAGIWGVISLLLLPKKGLGKSSRFEEEERRRDRPRGERGSHAA